MMVSVTLNLLEPQSDCFFRCDNAVGQLLRIEFKHCGFVDFEPRFVLACKHCGRNPLDGRRHHSISRNLPLIASRAAEIRIVPHLLVFPLSNCWFGDVTRERTPFRQDIFSTLHQPAGGRCSIGDTSRLDGLDAIQLRSNEHFQDRGSAADRSADCENRISDCGMFVCQQFQSSAYILELLGFVQQCFRGHLSLLNPLSG